MFSTCGSTFSFTAFQKGFPGIIPPAALAGMQAGGNALAGIADKAKNPVNVMQSMAQGMPNVPGAGVMT